MDIYINRYLYIKLLHSYKALLFIKNKFNKVNFLSGNTAISFTAMGRLSWEVFQAHPLEGAQDMLKGLCPSAGLSLRLPPADLEEVSGESEVWKSLLRLLPPSTRSRMKRKIRAQV